LKKEIYSPVPAEVKLVQTHISYVLIAGEFVYKIKKPVDFGFLDFTTLDKRQYYCEQELLLNRRLCPSIYLAVVGFSKDNGTYRILDNPARSDEAIEFGVKMARMPEEKMMANIMKKDELTSQMLDDICDVLVPFYEKSAGGPDIQQFGKAEAVGVNVLENFSQTEEFVGKSSLSRSRFALIRNYSTAVLENKRLFEARIEQGRIRDCHGDMYSANICLADKVYIFDCIEFNQRFRYCDVASDIAFLAMDLDFHGLSNLSDRFVKRFTEVSRDESLMEMLGFYKCYRAYVRGKINLFTAHASEIDTATKENCLAMAGRYFALAEQYASR
jgi:hypothetical protein